MDIMTAIENICKIYNESSNEVAKSEEATKHTLILPFIQSLGYNPFNPKEVVPEFKADFAQKNSNKVDYAIFKDGKLVMLIEAKKCGASLDVTQEKQLLYYFNATEAIIGLLTNGFEYRFYSDLEEKNKMDSIPFLKFTIDDIDCHVVKALEKFSKNAFDMDIIKSIATDLKYISLTKAYLTEQLVNPSDDFVKTIARQIGYKGNLNTQAVTMFKYITSKAFAQFVEEKTNDRQTGQRIENEIHIPLSEDTPSVKTAPKRKKNDLVHPETPSNVGIIWNLSQGSATARGKFTSDGFMLLKGSQISSNEAPSCPLSVKNAREEYKAKYEKDGILSEDIILKSPNIAAGFATGYSINAQDAWKTDAGKSMNDLKNS